VSSKAALAEFPPIALLATQLFVSLVFLSALMRATGVPFRGNTPPLLGRLGLLNPGIAYGLSLLGLTTITASVSVLLWILEPLLILVLAAIVLSERVTRGVLVLTAIAIAGTILVINDPARIGGELVGISLTVAGVACCATYTVLTRRFIPEATETSQVVFAQQAYGLAVALALTIGVALLGGGVIPTSLSLAGVASAVVSGVLYYAGAYWLYLGALRRVPASLAAGSFYLIPIVGVAAAGLLLGERLGATQWIGGAIVLASVLAIWVRSPSFSAPA
jgi:drug/metabolite transporter (DMT)-like permease